MPRDVAKALAQFAKTHSGRYAMGDRAGIAALLLEQPLLQLEGLVADAAPLAAIKEQRGLRELLESYDVDHLIAVLPIAHERLSDAEEPLD